MQFLWKIGENKSNRLRNQTVQLQYSSLLMMQVCKFHSWKPICSITLWYICNRCVKSSTPTVSTQDHTRCSIREADKEGQWLRGSCTQQVSNYFSRAASIYTSSEAALCAQNDTWSPYFPQVSGHICMSPWIGFLTRDKKDFVLQTILDGQAEFKALYVTVYLS